MFPVDATIMIVDDSSFARTVIKSGLKELNYWKILEADSAKQAKTLLQSEGQAKDPVHLLIADIHMPDMNGLELLRWVRTQSELVALPVIMLTALQEKSAIVEAAKLGVSHYMIKPFDVPTLKSRIQSTWEKCGQKYFEDRKRQAGA
ncbi:MAG TPA: response regulator [Bdellovibrionales bacterium]|nr:response regulator [Bdellovibrionales bacterium]